MWRFNLLGFRITVEPFFWLTCLLLGSGVAGGGRQGIALIVIWTLVVFVSILVHELGHALAARRYGVHPEIVLQGLGGLTQMHGAYLNRRQSLVVSAAGPFASLTLGFLVWLLARVMPFSGLAAAAVIFLLWVNFFWTAVNLLPVLPLDGGQIVRDLLGPRRAQVSLWLGVICGGAVGLLAFANRYYFLGVMMLLLAFGNFQGSRLRGGVGHD